MPSALDCPSSTGKHAYKVRFGGEIKPIGIFSVCCSQRKSCMRQSFILPAKKRALPSRGLSTCEMKEGSLGPIKEGEKASFLAGFISHLCGLGETNCCVEKGWGVGTPIFTYRRRALVFACAGCVTGLSWSLLSSYQQQPPCNLLVHETLGSKSGCNNGQSQVLQSH